MDVFSVADAFLVMLVGAGPVKAVLGFIALTRDMNQATRRRVAVTAVAVAFLVGAGLLLLGTLLQQALHFSEATLLIAAGIILLVLAVRMVISQGQSTPADHAAPVNAMSVAVFPLALPLTLNPIGIAALVIYSPTVSTSQGFVLLGALAAVLVIDLAVYLLAARLGKVPPALISVLETILGILLTALAVELILAGLDDAGII